MDISFFNDEKIINMLSKDIEELHQAMESKMNKASLVLIGSILESCLYYFISTNDALKLAITNFDKRELGLNDILQLARKHKLISEDLFRLTEPIRDLRNTIHPKVQEKFEGSINENMVQVAYNVLNQIIFKIKAQSAYFQEQNTKAIIEDLIRTRFNDEPDEIDYFIYVPILKKYGRKIGRIIINKSIDDHGR